MKLVLREALTAREGLLTTSQLLRSEQFRLMLTGGAGGGSFGISGNMISSSLVVLGADAVMLWVRGGVFGPPEPLKLEESLNIDSKGDGVECSDEPSANLGSSETAGDTSNSGSDAAHDDTLGNLVSTGVDCIDDFGGFSVKY